MSAPDCSALCPLCRQSNQCRQACGTLYKGSCWCEAVTIPKPVLNKLAEELPAGCLCSGCLNVIASWSAVMESPAEIVGRAKKLLRPPAPTPELTAEDFYTDDRGFMVFTAVYHRKRGFCCNSGCRHCPY